MIRSASASIPSVPFDVPAEAPAVPAPVVLLLLTLAGAASAAGTWMVRRYARRRSWFDLPNARSSHTRPTPRGGGLPIGVLWVAAAGVLWGAGILDTGSAAAQAGGLVIAWIGWMDDRRGLTAGARLVAQALTAAWAVAWMGGAPDLLVGSSLPVMDLANDAAAVVGVIWLTNLYNFMDGIDGLAGSESVVAGAVVALVLAGAGSAGLAVTTGVLVFASAGFLVWNWPPASIFMGDVGSSTSGYAVAVTLLLGWRTADVPILVLMIPFGVFLADATFTLIRRILRRERFMEAHRSHVYQRLVLRGWSHRRVTVVVAATNLLLGGIVWVERAGVLSVAAAGLLAAALVGAVGGGALRSVRNEAGRAVNSVG